MVEQALTPLKQWLITITVMLVAVAEVLDMTIVNVALPDMMGSLGANTDQITWVLTSYIVSAAVFMPLTGFLVNRLGRKRLLLINIVGFLVASILCGMANSLMVLVVFRTFQGIFGASLVPLSQIILQDTFSREEQPKAMAIWGIGIMAGPIFGPTLGGYITDALNWRWVFYINIPVCILAFGMALRLITETPRVKQHLDWLGTLLMITAIASLQLFLDRGNTADWFNAASIRWCFGIFIITLGCFLIRGWQLAERNIINLHLFKDRNFALATLTMLIFCMAIFGYIALQPLLMEKIMNYPPITSGLVMMPRGIASAVAMALVAKLIGQVNPRYLLLLGIMLCCIGSYWLEQINLAVDMEAFIIAGIWQGAGMGLFFVPLSIFAFSSLPKSAIAEASGLFSFGRSLGSSIGISLFSTMLSREQQRYWQQLGEHIQVFNPQLHYWLHGQGLSLSNPKAIILLTQQLQQQAGILAFIQDFRLATVSFAILIPCVFLLKYSSEMKFSQADLLQH